MVLWYFYVMVFHACFFLLQAWILVEMVQLSYHNRIRKNPYWSRTPIYSSLYGLIVAHLLFVLDSQSSLLELYLSTHGQFGRSASRLQLFQLNPRAFHLLFQRVRCQRLARILDWSSLACLCLLEIHLIRYFYLSSCFGLRHHLDHHWWCFN